MLLSDMNPALASPIHILPYLILLAIYTSLCMTSELTQNRYFHASAIGLALVFAGFRNTISPDMERYRYFYEHYRSGDYQKLIEPSFVLISTALNHLGFDYHALFFLYTFITIGFIYCAIRNLTGYVKTSMLFYILVPHLYLDLFIEMRQQCAVAIVFYTMSLLEVDKVKFRWLKVALLALASISFHYSAAGYWVIYILFSKLIKRKYPSKLYGAALLVSVLTPSSFILYVAYIALYPVMPPAYQGHITDLMALGAASGEHSITSILIYNSLALAFMFAVKAMKSLPKFSTELLNIFIIGVIILNITRAYGDMARFADYFIIYEIIFLPFLLFRIGDLRLRPVMIYGVTLLYFVHFIHGLYYLNAETGTYIFLHYTNALLSGQ